MRPIPTCTCSNTMLMIMESVASRKREKVAVREAVPRPAKLQTVLSSSVAEGAFGGGHAAPGKERVPPPAKIILAAPKKQNSLLDYNKRKCEYFDKTWKHQYEQDGGL